MPITKLYKKQKVNGGEFVHVDTGEMLNSVVDFTSVNVPTDKVTISSLEYIIIDSKAKRYVEQLFNQAECGRIFKMADMVYGCYNLLYKGNVPHTKETLSEELEYSRNKMTIFMKKLYKESIIHYWKGYKDGKEHTWIMLNPTFARKSKTFHTECISVFEDLSKK